MVLTAEDLQAISHMVAAAFANVQQPGGGAAVTTPSGRKVALHPKCFSRLDKFAGGEEKWREWPTTSAWPRLLRMRLSSRS